MTEFMWPVRVYYEDTDAGGVVFHANYLRFFERARTEMLRSYGYEQDRLAAEQDTVFVVRSANIEYLKPARFNDQLHVSTKISELRKTNLFFEQVIFRKEEALCRGLIRIACLELSSLKPKLIPFEFTEKLN